MAAEPAGVAAAGRKPPEAGQAIAALDRDGPAGAGQVRPPGKDAAGPAEHLLGGVGGKIGCDHRAAGILPETPGGAAVALRQFLEDSRVGQRVEFGAAEGFRQ